MNSSSSSTASSSTGGKAQVSTYIGTSTYLLTYDRPPNSELLAPTAAYLATYLPTPTAAVIRALSADHLKSLQITLLFISSRVDEEVSNI